MRGIPQLPRLIRMVLFFDPCNNGHIFLKVLSILPALLIIIILEMFLVRI